MWPLSARTVNHFRIPLGNTSVQHVRATQKLRQLHDASWIDLPTATIPKILVLRPVLAVPTLAYAGPYFGGSAHNFTPIPWRQLHTYCY
jgi:hypothetical protein